MCIIIEVEIFHAKITLAFCSCDDISENRRNKTVENEKHQYY